MNREKAREYIGGKVEAWTASNGVYVGTLQDVQAEKGKPWRAVVEIEGVREAACHYELVDILPSLKGKGFLTMQPGPVLCRHFPVVPASDRLCDSIHRPTPSARGF